MKIIFLGLMFCDESLKYVSKRSKNGIQMAPQKFQTSLLRGLEKNDKISSLTVINLPPMGSFPMNSKILFSRRYAWNKNNVQIGYLNLPIIKRWFQKRKIKKEVGKLISNDEKTVIVSYSLFEPYVDIIAWAKKKYPNVEGCLIQTDPVPGRGDFDRFMTSKAVKRGNRLVKKAEVFDSFVVLTKYLCDALETDDRPFVVVECVSDNEQKTAEFCENRNVFLYTGTLDEQYGIVELAQAFSNIPNAELRIYGNGNAKGKIEDLAKAHDNIKYFGFADQSVIKKEQDGCNYLINPRRPSGTYTKYSFPSKTVEYMMTGKPTVMYKLEGIPDSYDEYLIYLHGNSSDDIAKEIVDICNMDYGDLQKKAMKAREFIEKNASSTVQANKIIDMITNR